MLLEHFVSKVNMIMIYLCCWKVIPIYTLIHEYDMIRTVFSHINVDLIGRPSTSWDEYSSLEENELLSSNLFIP